MTINEYLKKHSPSKTTLDLIERLKEYSTDDDYVVGILLDCESEADKQELLEYIQNGEDVSYDNIILYAFVIAQNSLKNKIQLYDNVILVDERKASIVEILGDNEAFIVDIDIGGDYETETIGIEQIMEISNNPQCPECGSMNIAEIYYGYPIDSPKLHKMIENKEIVLGGCKVYSDVENDRWHCNDCGCEFC